MSFCRATLSIAVVICSAFAASSAVAQDWPSKPVRFVVPYTAGGGTDIVARMIGARLAEIHKQPFIIENRPGASGSIGGDVVAKAPADGHTVLFESQSIAVTPAIKKVTYEVDVTRLILRKLKLAVANGIMKADGEAVYHVTDMKVGLFQPAV